MDLGFEVAQAEHGQAALQLLQHGPVPDLACVDWTMPVMDGIEFVTAVRSNPSWQSLTIMMMTSQVEYEQVARALAAGAQEYLMKPFTPDAVRDKLALLSRLPSEVAR